MEYLRQAPPPTIFIKHSACVRWQAAADRNLRLTWRSVNGHQVGAPVRGLGLGLASLTVGLT